MGVPTAISQPASSGCQVRRGIRQSIPSDAITTLPWPHEPALLQSPRTGTDPARPTTAPYQIAAPTAKHKQTAQNEILRRSLLDRGGKPVKALRMSVRTDRQPHAARGEGG